MIASYDALSKTYPKPHMSLSHGKSLPPFRPRWLAKTVPTEVKTLTANQVMPVVVPKLLKAGYKLVTVAECLGLAPYQVVGKPSARDATWTCAGAFCSRFCFRRWAGADMVACRSSWAWGALSWGFRLFL